MALPSVFRSMRVTRRFLAVAGAGTFLAILGWVLASPVVLFGGVGIGAWLLTRAYLFVRAVTETATALSVDQTVTPERPVTEQPVVLSLRVEGKQRSIPMHVQARPPVSLSGSSADERTLALDPESASGSLDITLSCPVAGAFQVDPARVTVGDRQGLFAETFDIGSTPTVSVQPRVPRNIHVGGGGEAMATPYGTHSAGQGAGLEPAEIREYVPGDPARHIDWKATARLDEPYVREFEAETDRETALLVDTRGPMAMGPPGETKLDYARQVALGLVDAAADVGDPIGLYVVGDGGIVHRLGPQAATDRYPTVKRLLFGIEAATPEQNVEAAPPEQNGPNVSTTGRIPFGEAVASSPEVARRKASRLEEDRSAFGRGLSTYLESATVYVERLTENPLFRTAEREIAPLLGHTVTMLLTDDDDPVAVRETVELLRRGGNHVLVFLTPTVLYEPGGLADLETSFDRYVEFETFRRELHAMARVSAYEVGPRDRLDAVLSAGRKQRVREVSR